MLQRPRIGFVGLGMMGHGMARNILEKGWPLTVLGHRNRTSVEGLVGLGAAEAASPRDLASRCDMVFLCVTGAPQVEALVYGHDGLLEAARPGWVLVDATTSLPDLTRRIADDLADREAAIADAPVTRSPKDAEAGRLNSLVGAAEEVFARVRPVIECYSETVVHFGPVGAGHTAKLVNNFITMGYTALIAEGMAVAAAAGVDVAKLYEVMSKGGADSGVLRKMIPPFLSGDLTGHQFAIGNGYKDVGYFRDLVGGLDFASVMAPAVVETYRLAVDAGYGDRLMAALMEWHERNTGWQIVPRQKE